MANKQERPGITFDQVAAAAEALLSQGQQPTIRSVRESLGSGSPNTVHKHLTAWRESRPHVAVAAPELPAEIARVIAHEIERNTAEVRADLGNQLVRTQLEAAELSAAGELLELERESLLDQMVILASERDQLNGRADAQETEIRRQAADLERERQAAGELRIEVARARNKLEDQVEKLSKQAAELERLTTALDAEEKRRIEAEQAGAVAQERSTFLSERSADQATEIKRLDAELARERKGAEQARTDNAQLRTKLESHVEALAAARGEVEKLAAELATEEKRRVEAEQAAAVAKEKKVSLAEKIAGQGVEIKRLTAELDQERKGAEQARLQNAQLAADKKDTEPAAPAKGKAKEAAK